MIKSPFPGLDPYLEMHWGDVHHSLVIYARDQLQPRLPGELRARAEERVWVESDNGAPRSRYPDVLVVESRRPRTAAIDRDTAIATAEPLVIHIPTEPVTEGYINIIDVASGNRVITTIEFLSPSNKRPGPGRDAYLEKQHECRAAQVSLVEIDLTRAGQRELCVPASSIPESHRTTYQACVVRGRSPDVAELYRAPLRERLPVINIPLRDEDADITLDLQALIEQCYSRGRYDDIDYARDPEPPLPDDDLKWARELLQSRQRLA